MNRVFLAGIVLGAATVAQGQIVIPRQPVVATQLDVETLNTGTVLDVTATVSGDGRYVVLKMNPQFAQLEGIDTFQTGGTTGGIVGLGAAIGAGNAANVQLPAANFAPAPRNFGLAGNVPLQILNFTQTPPVFRAAQVGRVIFVESDKVLLSQKVPALTLQDISLKNAIKQLSAQTRTNLVLGIRGLQQAKVDINAPVSINLPAGTLKDDLAAILKMAAPGTDVVITAEEKVVTVESQAQADNHVVTKTYYAEDLIGNLPRYVAKDTDLTKIGNRQTEQEATDPLHEKKPARTSTNIMEIIAATVRPEIWKANGGKIGDMYMVGNKVTITAPQSVHALLDGPKHYDPDARPMYVGYGQ